MMSISFLRIRPRALLLATACALAACGPVNRGLESVHQPVVQHADYVLDLPAGGIDPAGRDRVAGWFDALRLGYGDRVSLDEGDDRSGARAILAGLVKRYGLRLEPVPAIAEGRQDGTMRVIVRRSFAHVTGCPDWRRASQPEFAGSTMSNFGCAVNSNLAAMVADPDDLVVGRATDPTDAPTTIRAIKTWRDTPPTGTRSLKEESTGGTSSGGK